MIMITTIMFVIPIDDNKTIIVVSLITMKKNCDNYNINLNNNENNNDYENYNEKIEKQITKKRKNIKE